MIHPTAVIDKEAVLGRNADIGAYAVIGKGVRIGDNAAISPYVHIKGDTDIGENVSIGSGAVIGGYAQMLGSKKPNGKIRIGRNNVLREYVTVNSSSSPDKETVIGENNLLMAFAHIAHDCRLGNNVVICNGSLVAGHVEIQDKAFISGNVVVHQFVRIGRIAMVGGLSRVNQDIPPFMMVVGDSKVWSVNLVGLKRAGFSNEDVLKVKKVFKILYASKLPMKKALDQIKEIDSRHAQEIIDFVSASKRGVSGYKRGTLLEKLFLDYPYFIRSKIETYDLLNRDFPLAGVKTGTS
ncbi:MAG: acyl-ACP--UDP-N-acetylglucosamine O-acyltransferase [Candidatus Omnitrophica bacterium]|nr:acyl-ACP--UDP-N-acetylglucosamine O-acyltransferase [Candidatus Omnitrophota bacterium]